VGLDVGAEAARARREERRHAADIPVHGGDVDDERGRRDVNDPHDSPLQCIDEIAED
jgi:hypothetical protein